MSAPTDRPGPPPEPWPETARPALGHQLRPNDRRQIHQFRVTPEFEASASVADETDGHALPSRRALCIGIDSYPQRPLRGCVNDSRGWARALRANGFRTDQLENAAATQSQIENHIAQLLRRSAAGGHAVIVFAGHATQLPSADPSQLLTRAWVPIDHVDAGCIDASDLRRLLLPYARKIAITLISDCSRPDDLQPLRIDSMAGAAAFRRARFLKADAATLTAHRSRKCGDEPSPSRNWKDQIPWIELSACDAQAVAFETGDQGDFSSAALPRLEEALRADWSPLKFADAVGDDLARSSGQCPRVFGADGGRSLLPLLGGSQTDARETPRAG